jgi:ATPase subunit of ABC transporter with duplicated ATPase domains
MPAVHFRDVSFRHSSAVEVLSDVTLPLGPGWTAVVGANGAGKTTLLRLITGELRASRGSITLDPSDAIVVMCRQEVEHADDGIVELAAAWDRAAVRLRARLALDPGELDRWGSLSPGERKRWQIGAALARSPDVLLLDEPTNHLDADGRRWLLDALERFGGVGLVVSHDRTLLEALTTRTLRIHRGTATLWNGSYGVASAAWTAAAQEELAEYRRLRREEKKLSRRVTDQRRATEAKQAAYRRSSGSSDFKDIDARSAAKERRHREGEAAGAKALSTAVGARDRVTEAAAQMNIVKDLGGALSIDFEPSPKADLVVVQGDVAVADHVVLRDVMAVVERTDRIWLRGANGEGKTTLLHAMRERTAIPEDRILFLPQEVTSSEGAELMARLRSLPADQRGRVLAVVAALGVDPEALLATDRPSPGEVRKLAMALGLGTQAWLLLLDEPTNHLDLPSIERLEAALVAFPAAMVLVTHDEAFGAALGLASWTVADGRLET